MTLTAVLRPATELAVGSPHGLWVSNHITLRGDAVEPGIALAVILDPALAACLFRNGASVGISGQTFHYMCEG